MTPLQEQDIKVLLWYLDEGANGNAMYRQSGEAIRLLMKERESNISIGRAQGLQEAAQFVDGLLPERFSHVFASIAGGIRALIQQPGGGVEAKRQSNGSFLIALHNGEEWAVEAAEQSILKRAAPAKDGEVQ